MIQPTDIGQSIKNKTAKLEAKRTQNLQLEPRFLIIEEENRVIQCQYWRKKTRVSKQGPSWG